METSQQSQKAPDLEVHYVVLFHGTEPQANQSLVGQIDPEQANSTTRVHGLDRELIPTLRTLWYCLHLPRTQLDTAERSLRSLAYAHNLNLHHRIVLTPAYAAAQLLANARWLRRGTLIICPDDLHPMALELTERFGLDLPPSKFSEIGASTLNCHWSSISDLVDLSLKRFNHPPEWNSDFQSPGSWISLQWMTRNLPSQPVKVQSKSEVVSAAIWANRFLTAKLILDDMEQPDEKADELIPIMIKDAPFRTRINVAVACSGTSSWYRREMSSGVDPALLATEDNAAEQEVVSFLAAHHACGTHGISIDLQPISTYVFHWLDQLESHCTSDVTKPKYVWKVLNRLGQALADHLGDEGRALLTHAESLTAFSEIPFGLAILPGRSAPLACQIQVAHRPVTPLTRALQLATLPTPTIYLKKGFKLLIAECLDPSDPIHSYSAAGWKVLSDSIANIPGVDCEIIQIKSESHLKQTLSSTPCEMLLLSGHGFNSRTSNAAGIVIGGKPTLGLELDRVPPIVLISACHVAPRGHGAVTIADLMIAKGAMAVLGTLIPVNVRRNSLLMTRLFVYIGEAIAEGRFRTLADVWTHVLATNAMNEILASSDTIQNWAHEGSIEQSVIWEFQRHRSVGRLRAAHVYEDTERILQKMADERGFGSTFRSTLKSQGYFPESLFYYFLGQPNRIVFHDPLAELIQEGIPIQ